MEIENVEHRMRSLVLVRRFWNMGTSKTYRIAAWGDIRRASPYPATVSGPAQIVLSIGRCAAISPLLPPPPPRHAPREDAPAQERPLQRAVAVHPAAAETRHLAGSEHVAQRLPIRPQHAPRQVGLQPAQRLARQNPQPHGDQRPRLGVEQAVRLATRISLSPR